MQQIEIEPNQFINRDEVADVAYDPATTRPGRSLLTIRLTNGKEYVLHGAQAEEVYAKLDQGDS
jgi:hypothetical protein